MKFVLHFPEFLIPDYRFVIGICSLLVTITFPLHATTPGFDTLVNYDTAWTFVYDGGKDSDGGVINDRFYDIKVLPDNNGYICVGGSRLPDSLSGGDMDRFLLKLDVNGKMIWKRYYRTGIKGGCLRSIVIARNGDYITGGTKYGEPWIAEIDTTGEIKWETWLWDTVALDETVLSRGAAINYLRQTSRGTIVCAAGDQYPYGSGNGLNDYAAFLEFDSLGSLTVYKEWEDITSYEIAGFSVEETKGGELMFGGNQAVFYLDTIGNVK
jgi:hypothetical protein